MPPAASEVSAQLGDWLLDPRSNGATALVTGDVGTGKTLVLEGLAEQADLEGRRCIRLSPPSSDLDGPANALAQGAARMREFGANGVLDPIFDPKASFDTKLDALVQGLDLSEDALVLVDVPESWARPSRANSSGGTFAYRGHRLVREILARGGRHRVVLAAPGGFDAPEAEEFQLSRDYGNELLGAIEWGQFSDTAASLGELVPRAELRKLTPLELRVAVALRAFELDERLLKNACRGRWPELRRMLQGQVQSRPWLHEAFFVMSHARIGVGQQLLENLLALCDGRDATGSQAVLKEVLLMPEGVHATFHPRMRKVDTQLAPQRQVELADQVNRQLAQAWESIAARDSWQGVVAWWESLHHWAEAGEDERLSEAPDISMWTTLGRRRSLWGDYETAVAAFRRALELQPDDSYAHEYLAYNLDRCKQGLVEAERGFRRAVELDPENPWWNRRLVQALQRRGKIDAAWDAWIAALGRLEGVADPSIWMQQNLHEGVCKGFLIRGQPELAAAVLESVPRVSWTHGLERLWNTVCHRREAAELEAAVFPETVDFETRWRGPRLGTGLEPAQWYPGRIIAVDDDAAELELELAEPPLPGQVPELFTLVLGREEFLEQAELPARAVLLPGIFLELHLEDDESQRIYLHPNSRVPGRQKGASPSADLLDDFR